MLSCSAKLLALVFCLFFVACDAPPPTAASCDFWRVDSGHSQQTAYVVSDPYLNELQTYFKPTLDANRKTFLARQPVEGFGAGSSYPQIWLRDSATIIPASRFYYSRDYLQSWIEEHLRYQQTDGQLYDWFASGPPSSVAGAAPNAKEVYRSANRVVTADKNSTESDQETSAIDAAWQVYKITGDRDWLNKSIEGRTIISRLNLGLEFLFKHRLDGQYGLITSAFTADWGDVSPTYPDQRAIYLDTKTPLVVGIYTNALAYRAALQLEELNRAVGDETSATNWKTQAALIRTNVNKTLWQNDRGYFRIHVSLNAASGYDDRFALGGNAMAVLTGLADDNQAQSIFTVAEERRRSHGVSTISGTLLPPYPRGFFKHPAVSEEYVYQNGGQWDWFGGRFVLAEFEAGKAESAYSQLTEIAKKAADNKGLFEWHSRNGEGKGSRDYAGSAGALAGAIYQGLFGVYLGHDNLLLRIRLGEHPAKVHIYEPATQQSVEYEYCYDATTNSIRVSYEATVSNTGKLHIRLPSNRQAAELSVDRFKIQFTTETIGDDAYVVVDTDWKPHVLQVRLLK